MKVMFKVKITAAKGNEAVKSGALEKLVRKFMEDTKPEATYFMVLDGCRTMISFINLQKNEDMVRLAEPLFVGLDAEIELTPVMGPEELARGLGAAA